MSKIETFFLREKANKPLKITVLVFDLYIKKCYNKYNVFNRKVIDVFTVKILFGLFFIFSGVVKYRKHLPVSQWSWKRIYFMFAYCMWGFGLMMSGLSGFIPHITREANILYGATFFLMIFAPCGMRVFHTQPAMRLIRNLIFVVLGLLIITTA